MQAVTTIGFDIAKFVFRFTALTQRARALFSSDLGGHGFSASSRSFRLAWLVWRHAPPRTTGHASCRHSGTRFD